VIEFLTESVKILYSVNEKCVAKPTEGDSTPQFKKKSLMNADLLKHVSELWLRED
jgi:hypothetical protein